MNHNRIAVGLLLIVILTPGCTIEPQEETSESFESLESSDEKGSIIFFYTPDCKFCSQVEEWLEELKKEHKGKISIRHVNVLTKEGWDEYREYSFMVTPAVVVKGHTNTNLRLKEITTESLSEAVHNALGEE